MTASGELPLPVSPDVPPSGKAKHHGTEVNTLVDLYRHHQQRIYRYCLALLRNPDDAEDATQETFTRAAPFLPNLPGDLSAYLTTVARNICCDVVRARARRSVPIETVPLADRAVSPERQSVDWDVVRRMWRQLSPSERLLFAYTFAGYKYEEIASRTGMSRPSVSVGLARARRRLRDLAAATGTLALLPAGIRRLLERFSRRANNAVAAAQGQLAGLMDQVGTVAVSLVTGLFAAGTTATVALPAMAPVADHVALGAGSSAVADSAPAGAQAPAPSTTSARAATPASPAPPAAQTPLVNTAAPLLPGADATPDVTSIDGMAVSPNYTNDHTVFISGQVYGTCAGGCGALFRTTDGGASWTRLALETYQLGDVLLPPAYPQDPAFFVEVPSVGLLESPAGDGALTPVLPQANAVAIAPESAVGNARIAAVINGASLIVYEAGSKKTTPGPQLPAAFIANGLAFSSSNTLVVTGHRLTTGTGVAGLTVCSIGGICAQPFWVPSTAQAATIVASPSVDTDHLVIADDAHTLYVSKDGGANFSAVWTAPAGVWIGKTGIGSGPAGPRIVVNTFTGYADVEKVNLSDDLGQSFTSITGDLNATNRLAGIDVLRGGYVLAGLSADSTHRFALRETTANGLWTNAF